MRSLAANLLHARGDLQWSLAAQDRDEVIPIRSLPAQIGRHPGVPIRVVHPTVSLVHADRFFAGAIRSLDTGSSRA